MLFGIKLFANTNTKLIINTRIKLTRAILNNALNDDVEVLFSNQYSNNILLTKLSIDDPEEKFDDILTTGEEITFHTVGGTISLIGYFLDVEHFADVKPPVVQVEPFFQHNLE
ncbi:uncharacterized protein LOC131952735 [Physella acuta]|uniref:uncharacterized protein LOC131952735 n=1 Tax=Physella acuta TaxID=109671 RepID=UPI0027DC220F|nr:uncharacterized protein LOC131952735 [Physella acuta]